MPLVLEIRVRGMRSGGVSMRPDGAKARPRRVKVSITAIPTQARLRLELGIREPDLTETGTMRSTDGEGIG